MDKRQFWTSFTVNLYEWRNEINNPLDFVDTCEVLECLPAYALSHPVKIVVSEKPLADIFPLCKGEKGKTLSQAEIKTIEKMGLASFGLLSLRGLTVISDTLSLITDKGDSPSDILNLDLNDPDTFHLLQSGDTNEILQFESSGMQEMVDVIGLECFDDMVSLVALFRPGPLEFGIVDEYYEKKHGKIKIDYVVPELEPILNETYSVLIFQEQLMNIAVDLAGFDMSSADILRRSIGKKQKQEIGEFRDRFIQGASANGIHTNKAEKIFEILEHYGYYSFLKAHATAYSLISYQIAYLKAHYPLEFDMSYKKWGGDGLDYR